MHGLNKLKTDEEWEKTVKANQQGFRGFGFGFNYFSIEKVIFPISVHPAVPGPGIDVSFRRADAMEGGGFLELLYANTTTPFV